MRMMKKLVGVSVASLMLFQSVAASASMIAYLTLAGQKQGKIKGSVTQKGRTDENIGVIAFTHGAMLPRDWNNLPAERKTHEPVVVTMASDPLVRGEFQRAMDQKELFTSFALTYSDVVANGQPQGRGNLLLQNAHIEKIDILPPDGTHKLEEMRVAFTFEKINTTWTKGSVTTNDDWTAPTN